MLLGGSGPTLRKHGRLRSSMPVQPQLHVRSLAQDSYAVCSFICNPLQLLSVACGSSTLATTPIKEVVVGVCGYRRDGDSRSLVLGVPPSGGSAETRNVTCHGGPRMDVRDDLLRRLTMISLIDALRMEHSPLISAGIAIAMAAGWVPDRSAESEGGVDIDVASVPTEVVVPAVLNTVMIARDAGLTSLEGAMRMR